MIHILLSFLIGSFISLILISPQEYYLVLFTLPLIAIVLVILLKKSIPRPKKYIALAMPFVIILSYLLTSFVVFMPCSIDLVSVKKENIKSNKEGVILYTDGEMEKYIPYFVIPSVESKPLLLKPIESYKIKMAYDSINISEKNIDLLRISKDLQQSILKNSPSFYYLAYSKYTPSLKESINYALKDGCSTINIINLSSDPSSTDKINTIKPSLESYGITVNVTSSVIKNLQPDYLLKDLKTDISKYSGVLVLDNDNLAHGIPDYLKSKGACDQSIFINSSAKDGLKIINDSFKDTSGPILIINLLDFKNGILEKYTINNNLLDNISYEILSPLKYDKYIIELIINEYQLAKTKS